MVAAIAGRGHSPPATDKQIAAKAIPKRPAFLGFPITCLLAQICVDTHLKLIVRTSGIRNHRFGFQINPIHII